MTPKIASKPLFRDPIFDGAADPVEIYDRANKRWLMFYTNRRANVPTSQSPGVTWVHGTHIGIAQSIDGGATWTYVGTANIETSLKEVSFWAPEIIEHDGLYHMYLTVVPGIFENWNYPRDICHYTSRDLLNWKYESTLKLASDRVIDAAVIRMNDGTWRMWYNEERDGKAIRTATSPDLYHWTEAGKIPADQAGEGPYVFKWKGSYWMIKDIWQGLAAYRSDDAIQWHRQPTDLLKVPGTGPDDTAKGQHPSVIVSGDRAYLFYFTHPGNPDKEIGDAAEYARRRSSIQVVELDTDGQTLSCDRNTPTQIAMEPR